MDVLALILTCSVYPDEHLVRAMVDLASQGNPYFVGDVATLLTFDQSRSPADGKRLVAEIEKQGGRPAVGLLALPIGWASRGGNASVDLFDGCTNLRVGTRVMREHLDACTRLHSAVVPATPVDAVRTRTAPPEALRQCALRRFAADLGMEGFAEAVFQYLPKHRVLGGVTVATADSCRCEAAPNSNPNPPSRPRRRPATQASATAPPRDTQPPPPPLRFNPGVAPILE